MIAVEATWKFAEKTHYCTNAIHKVLISGWTKQISADLRVLSKLCANLCTNEQINVNTLQSLQQRVGPRTESQSPNTDFVTKSIYQKGLLCFFCCCCCCRFFVVLRCSFRLSMGFSFSICPASTVDVKTIWKSLAVKWQCTTAKFPHFSGFHLMLLLLCCYYFIGLQRMKKRKQKILGALLQTITTDNTDLGKAHHSNSVYFKSRR